MSFAQSVRGFVQDVNQIINPNNPNVPVGESIQSKTVQYMNELLAYYSGTGLLLTIATRVDFTMAIGQQYVLFADPNYPGFADIKQGRLANLENAWLTLDGVTYPLVDETRNVFFDSYKYDPQEGLPRFCIITNETNLTRMRVYPSPSQVYDLSVYGKFEMSSLTINGDMSSLPLYYIRFLRLAVAKEVARYTARMQAWTPDLQRDLEDAQKEMEACSAVNLAISADHDSYLNGSWRVRAGI